MRLPDFENLNSVKPDLATIFDLKQKGFIRKTYPSWWSTDYAPDPREYMTIDKLRSKLAHLGRCDILKWGDGHHHTHLSVGSKDVYLYPEPQVPMTVLELAVEDRLLPFLITVRPYHQKEIFSYPAPLFIEDHPLGALPDFVKSGGKIDLPDHFYPHIRGLYAGRRGNHLFWYPLNILECGSFSINWDEFGKPIRAALEELDLGFLGIYNHPFVDEHSRFPEVWNELLSRRGEAKLVDQKHPAWVDFEHEEISVEEFLASWEEVGNKEPLVCYPIRYQGLKYTLPLIITAITNEGNRIRKPVILGVLADNGCTGYAYMGGICRILREDSARDLSQLISADFGTPVDAVLFTPSKGRPKYRRISAN